MSDFTAYEMERLQYFRNNFEDDTLDFDEAKKIIIGKLSTEHDGKKDINLWGMVCCIDGLLLKLRDDRKTLVYIVNTETGGAWRQYGADPCDFNMMHESITVDDYMFLSGMSDHPTTITQICAGDNEAIS